MKQAESAAEIILRTCERFHKIKHLPSDLRKHLMGLSEEEFQTRLESLKQVN
ncbi:MAG: hypothetical protein HC815_40575 [Richelia sp. RM1_1_1]|nr:hypothetical protein [Richelia sp. RM1_1_1]